MTPADILTLAHLYGVSAEAMTLRLEELALLKTGAWESLQIKGSNPTRRKNSSTFLDHHTLAACFPIAMKRWRFAPLTKR